MGGLPAEIGRRAVRRGSLSTSRERSGRLRVGETGEVEGRLFSALLVRSSQNSAMRRGCILSSASSYETWSTNAAEHSLLNWGGGWMSKISPMSVTPSLTHALGFPIIFGPSQSLLLTSKEVNVNAPALSIMYTLVTTQVLSFPA